MKKKEIIKGAVKLVAASGVGMIVTNAVTFTTPVIGMSLLRKGLISIGSFVLSTMVSEKACAYTDEKMDQAYDELVKLAEEEDKEKEVAKS